jgi:hypothetical protein
MESFPVLPVIDNHIKTAGHGNDELLQFHVPVSTPLGASRHVIEIINALDLEGDMPATLNECQVPASVGDPWKINYVALVNAHHDASNQRGSSPNARKSETAESCPIHHRRYGQGSTG